MQILQLKIKNIASNDKIDSSGVKADQQRDRYHSIPAVCPIDKVANAHAEQPTVDPPMCGHDHYY